MFLSFNTSLKSKISRTCHKNRVSIMYPSIVHSGESLVKNHAPLNLSNLFFKRSFKFTLFLSHKFMISLKLGPKR